MVKYFIQILISQVVLTAWSCCGVATTACNRVGDVRLVGGENDYEGRVEVCVKDIWGTVCDDSWDTRDAIVVCRQLGFLRPNEEQFVDFTTHAYFGEGRDPIWLDDVDCDGSESNLVDCHYNNGRNFFDGYHNCEHSEDAGVKCMYMPDICNQSGDVRLVGFRSQNDYKGRMEICINNVWGTICDDGWDILDAYVVCRQLGYTSVYGFSANGVFGEGTGNIWLQNVECDGSESRLIECDNSGIGVHNCHHDDDVEVTCLRKDESNQCNQPGDIRLVGKGRDFEGRVEVCHYSVWGTVCDDNWDIQDATVVCRQLGFAADALQAYTVTSEVEVTGPIWLDDVHCAGSELKLTECSSNALGVHNCNHNEDAGVTCSSVIDVNCTTIGDIRLVGSESDYEGRVEICINNLWSVVCVSHFLDTAASVACKQLGFVGDAFIFASARFRQVRGPFRLDDSIQCKGNESRLIDCDINGLGVHNSAHCSEVAEIACLQKTCNQSGDIRLVGGKTGFEGQVEICYDDVWSTVCADSFWSIEDAAVVCRQLGFVLKDDAVPIHIASIYTQSYFGHYGAASQMWPSNVNCDGTESRLIDCDRHLDFSGHVVSCSQPGNAGIECYRMSSEPCPHGELRLVGGASEFEGSVELCYNNVWSTYCYNEDWDEYDALVVCRQIKLDFSGFNATLVLNKFESGNRVTWLESVLCTGKEFRLIHCLVTNTDQVDEFNSCSSVVGVRCNSMDAVKHCEYGDIRLVGGASDFEGRVEICINNIWSTVCDEEWTSLDAEVVCTQIGFYMSTGIKHAVDESTSVFGMGTGSIFLLNPTCLGSEDMLLQCTSQFYLPLRDYPCNHNQDVGVRCIPYAVNPNAPATTGETADMFVSTEVIATQEAATVASTETHVETNIQHSPVTSLTTEPNAINQPESDVTVTVKIIGGVIGLVLFVLLLVILVIIVSIVMVHNRRGRRSLRTVSTPLKEKKMTEPTQFEIYESIDLFSESDTTDGSVITSFYPNAKSGILPLTEELNGAIIVANTQKTEKQTTQSKAPLSRKASSYFEESDSYWKPSSNRRDLLQQLASSKYRDIPRDQIKIIKHLGSGWFGTVSKGVWQLPGGQSKDVTVKLLRKEATEVNKVKFLQEAAINVQFQHPNVVKLMGVVIIGDLVLTVIEFLANGDLRTFLCKMKPSPKEFIGSDVTQLLLRLNRFCIQIASGMEYLSGKNFVHQGLMARSILVSADKYCKISNFGVACGRELPAIKWTALEAVHNGMFSTASDVWSFGVVMYEIWGLGHEPFESFTGSDETVLKKIDQGYRLPPPPGCPKEMYHLMIQCWNPDPSSRPTFSQLYNQLPKNPRSQYLTVDLTGENCKDLHPQANILGAPLEAGNNLYPNLQSSYALYD